MKLEDLESRIEQLNAEIQELKKNLPRDKITIAVLNAELDKVLSAFVIATAAAAMDMEVVMYFTFWAVAVLRDKNKQGGVKAGTERTIGENLPGGASEIGLAEHNPGGIKTEELKAVMKKKNIPSLEEMITVAEELGVRIYIAAKAIEMLGFKPDEFIDYKGLSFAGVATFIEEAQNSKIQLII